TGVSGFKQAIFFSGLQATIPAPWWLWSTDHPAWVLRQVNAPLFSRDIDSVTKRIELANDSRGRDDSQPLIPVAGDVLWLQHSKGSVRNVTLEHRFDPIDFG